MISLFYFKSFIITNAKLSFINICGQTLGQALVVGHAAYPLAGLLGRRKDFERVETELSRKKSTLRALNLIAM